MKLSGEVTRVAIAGATGFVGRALAQELAAHVDVVGLTRSDRVSGTESEDALEAVQWRRVDLFSLLECELSLEGVSHAFYLVHSMMPSARLTQASFDDLDLILADNFARAAERAGVKQIIYLGGIVPPGKLSAHLRSRREVEHALASTGVPTTCVRAGLVLGPGGSSTRMMTRLVAKLPVMACPRWTDSEGSPIDLRDLVKVLCRVLGHPEITSPLDVGGQEVISYRNLMQRTAAVMGHSRRFIGIPLFSPGLSTLWVSLITGSSRDLVRPLVHSLRHSMVPEHDAIQRAEFPPEHSLDESLANAVVDRDEPRTRSWESVGVRDRRLTSRNTVRSVQRLPNGSGLSAAAAASEYMRWLPRFLRPFLRVDADANGARFGLIGLSAPLLVLDRSMSRSEESRPLFYVTGGLLARPELSPQARLEFRSVLNGEVLLSAIHDFVPRLPWFIYNATQALAHLWVMGSFGRHLAQTPPEALPATSEAAQP